MLLLSWQFRKDWLWTRKKDREIYDVWFAEANKIKSEGR